MLPLLLFEAVRLSWVRGGDDAAAAVLFVGAGLQGGVAATSLFVGLSADCSARRLLMGSFSAAEPRVLLCVMEVKGKGSSSDCAGLAQGRSLS